MIVSVLLAVVILAVSGAVSAALGRRYFPELDGWARTVLVGVTGLMALATLLAGVYFFYRLTLPAVVAVLICLGAAAVYFARGHFRFTLPSCPRWPRWPLRRVVCAVLALSGDILLIAAAWLFRTGDSLQSPWVVLPVVVVPLFGLTTFALACFLDDGWGGSAYWLLGAHAVAAFGLVELVYAYGFGFDPFIHRATEDYIAAHDFIMPKQPFYNGQYVLVVAAHWLTRLSVDFLDRLLVPALAVLSVPVFARLFVKSQPATASSPVWVLAAAWLLPFLPLAFTTPNNLVALLLFWVVCLAPLAAEDWRYQIISGLMAMAALAIHPLLGVMVVAIAAAPRFLRVASGWLWRALLVALAVGLSLPAFFALNNWRQGQPPLIGGNPLERAQTFWILFLSSFPVTLNGIWDRWSALYAWEHALPWFLAALAIAGGVWLWRAGRRHLVLAAATIVLGTLVATFLMTTEIRVQGVIDWEQSEFSYRLLDGARRVAMLLWLPGLAWLMTRYARGLRRYVAFFILAGLLTASWYLTYPQANPHSPFVGWGLGDQHWEVVDFIHEQGGAEPYLVLSDQMFSVAALRRFGFENLPYAIPTGGRLYEYFLDMAQGRRSRDVAEEAMSEFGVKHVFFVMSDSYMDLAPFEQDLVPSANRSWKTDDAHVLILEFSR